MPTGPAAYQSGVLRLSNGGSLRLTGAVRSPAIYPVTLMRVGDRVAACYGHVNMYADAGPARTITILDLRTSGFYGSEVGTWPRAKAVMMAPSASLVATVATNATPAINAQVGQTFVVALDANPSTGYSWSVLQNDAAGVVEALGSTSLNEQSGRFGASGTQLLLFRAVHPGKGSLVLHYVRPFDRPSVAPAKTKQFPIAITT